MNRAPAFSAATATREFPENTGPGLKVDIPVGATDVDANDVLEYTLEGTDKDFFEIVPTNGQIKTKEGVTYDHEDRGSYSVTVKVDDKSGGTDTIDVTINVTDVNEKPSFTVTESVAFSIAENTSANTNIGNPVAATDPDNGDTLTYSLSGTDADSFNINTSTGQLQTKAAPDFEDKPEYYLTVWVRDSRGDDGTADTTNDASIPVTISVTDVNEPPAFPSTEIGRRNVDETSLPGSNIGVPVGAIDPEGDSLTYTLDRDDEGLLSIDGATGQIRMADGVTLDHETTPSYTVIVSVSDSKDAHGNSDTITDDTVTVTITVADGDEPPVLTGQAAVSYPENGDGPVHTYTAIDPERATIKWSLTGDDVGDFSFEGGVLAFDRSPDYETPTDTGTNNQYSVTVVASDGPNPVERAVTVTVTNVNEAPDFDSATATRNVPENTPANQPVGQPVPATDPESNTLTYTLGGTDSASFGINSGTGQITVGAGAALDYETKSSYQVTVTATDSSNLSDTITVNIDVTEGNDPPVFATDTATRRVAENTGTGQGIGDAFRATDADASDSPTYTLKGTDAASFNIVTASGQLRTKAALDHEDKSIYSVTVEASDGNGGGGSIDVTITVTDVDEPPVKPGQPDVGGISAYSASMKWSKPDNEGRPDITGYDYRYKKKDELNWSGATYAITGAVTNTTIRGLEASTSYDVQVRAKNDEGTGPWSASGTGATQARPNTSPAFASSPVTRDVPENTPANTNIGDPVTATDADNDNLTYTLEGKDSGSFGIVAGTGQLQTKDALNHETMDSYTVKVKASDGKDGVDTINVTITVTDVNEAPNFGSLTATRTVLENTRGGQPVGQPVPATDPEFNTLTYTLGGTDSASFGISSSTGQITVGVGTTLDFETKPSYEVTVTATDSLNLSDTITVTIKVTEGNDPPVFATDTATRSVAENTGTGLDIGVPFTATDAEDETLNYTLEGTDAASFGIVSTSGQLQTKVALDYEVESSYSVTVKAADAGASGTITVTITVTDVNEPPLAPGTPAVSGDSASSVSVTWTAPANAGKPDITGYDYQYKKTGEPTWSGATYATTGVVTSATISGLDSSTSYDVQARAKNDEGTGPWSATGAGSTGNTIPAFSSPTVTRDVAENTPADVNIGDPVTATDDDNGDSLTYTIGGTDAASFDIDSKTGQLKTKALLDREAAKNTYTVIVTATDSANATAEATVTITVTNVNEPPHFGVDAANRKVDENTPPGDPVGPFVSAEDDDAGDTLTYSMGGADSASFGIDSSTGLITVGSGTRLDFETRTTYEVTVTATDSSFVSATITVTIEVLNVNEDGVVTLSQLQPQVDTAPEG